MNHRHRIIARPVLQDRPIRKGQRYAVLQKSRLVVIKVGTERVAKIVQVVKARLTPPNFLTSRIRLLTQQMHAVTLNKNTRESSVRMPHDRSVGPV